MRLIPVKTQYDLVTPKSFPNLTVLLCQIRGTNLFKCGKPSKSIFNDDSVTACSLHFDEKAKLGQAGFVWQQDEIFVTFSLESSIYIF